MSSFVWKGVCLLPLNSSVSLAGHNILVHILILSVILPHYFLALDALSSAIYPGCTSVCCYVSVFPGVHRVPF